MAEDFEQIGNFLSRWSRRKLEKTGPAPADSQAQAPASQEATEVQPAESGAEAAAGTMPDPLPSVDSLTPASDFAPFMRSTVDPDVKTAALKQLFKDPHFNVMDGLDTYIEDYGIPDPIPAAMMKTLYQAREHLFSDEEKAAADVADAAEDAAAEEKALADAADALDAEQKAAEDDLHRALQAADNEAQSADPTAPEPKDA